MTICSRMDVINRATVSLVRPHAKLRDIKHVHQRSIVLAATEAGVVVPAILFLSGFSGRRCPNRHLQHSISSSCGANCGKKQVCVHGRRHGALALISTNDF